MDYVKKVSTYLCNSEVDDEWWVLWIWQWSTSSIVATEVSSTINDDTLYWNAEATVQSNNTIRFHCLLDTINETSVLTVSISFANISTQTSTSVIQWIDKAKWSGSGSTTRSQVSEEVAPELCLLINTAQEDLFVDILEGEVESLGWEISDDISQITTPESSKALFLWDTDEAVNDTWKITRLSISECIFHKRTFALAIQQRLYKHPDNWSFFFWYIFSFLLFNRN